MNRTSTIQQPVQKQVNWRQSWAAMRHTSTAAKGGPQSIRSNWGARIRPGKKAGN